MPRATKRWIIHPPISDAERRARFPSQHPLLAQILHNRGVRDDMQARAFLAVPGGKGGGMAPGSLSGTVAYHDPFQMLGMTEAVDRIRTAIRSGERMVVYGDFDADGVTATAVLMETFQALGATVKQYIPHRVDEGYGLHCEALDKIAEWGARLVVTVDCGIRSMPEVAYAKNLGIDMIVTDHHAPWRILPPALVIVNPRQEGCPYPFKELAGVGIAFKLAQALLLAEGKSPVAPCEVRLTDSDLVDLVALGSVADVVPLLGENRLLVQQGLYQLNRTRRPGILAMLEEADLQPDSVTAGTIGFVLGPRLNAAGRLATAKDSYHLLTTRDMTRAVELAHKLGHLNRERQRLTVEMLTIAREEVEAGGRDRYLHIVARPEFSPGVVGLVAGRLTEELYRPTLVAQQGAALTQGSARSIPELDITAALDECRDLLVRHGGHATAAGFAVENEKLPLLRDRLEEIAGRELQGQEDLRPTLLVDAVVRLSDLDWSVQRLFEGLEPCGAQNHQPLLVSKGLEVVEKRLVGSESQHLKLSVRDGAENGCSGGRTLDAIAFRQGATNCRVGGRVDLVYALEVNEYNGTRRLQLNVKDIGSDEAC